ncbi:helix-turn-helix transcriptional regulator [Micromonospora aurantiaca]|uniref:helix-turn-helix transcriptional regulator n=1 Tax=Micromonospora aurantiaca (nom. illeg.) TaxID=47850 RepID=UPI002E183354
MPMGDVDGWRTLGVRLAQLRRAAGYNQHSFAPLTGYARSTIANVETGRQRAPREFWQRCDELVGAAGSLLSLYDQAMRQQQGPPSMPEEAELEAVDTHAAPTTVARTSMSPVDPAIVPHWMSMLRILAASHDAFGPRRLHDVVRGELNIIRRHRAGAAGQTLRELLRVESRWAEFASWTADNLGDSQDAAYWLRQSLSMAREAADGRMATYVLMRQAQRAVERGDSAQAIALAEFADARKESTARDRALCAVRTAQAAALAGRRARCQSALQKAHSLVGAAEGLDDPDTIGLHCTRTYVLAYEGQCHLILGQAKQSIAVLEAVLRAWPSAYRQDEALARAWLATGYANLGRVDEAADQGEQALTIALDAGSIRLIKALSRVEHELRSRRVTDEAQRFRDRLALADQVVGRMGQ